MMLACIGIIKTIHGSTRALGSVPANILVLPARLDELLCALGAGGVEVLAAIGIIEAIHDHMLDNTKDWAFVPV